jgi:F-type H+-transporting ATPase subunit epsilon
MNLKVLLPNEVYLDQPVIKVVAEAVDGCFCLLPHHVDFVAALSVGVVLFEDEQKVEHFLATDEGVLAKVGSQVTISTRNAARSNSLGELKAKIQRDYGEVDEREKLARSASARLEAGLVRRFLELEGRGV